MDMKNPEIGLTVSVVFNNKLGSEKAKTKPFSFLYELNFNTKESVQIMNVTFDANKVKNIVKVEDFQEKLLEKQDLKDLPDAHKFDVV